ncbi:hypothetical protein C8F04DRAFT_1232875 [Mycena alexandri]|uniref:Uncharacterized protein n=1 Tax=Mycena alexandri TaxID=1745969 RepID=A0AAD6T479_9AGAR|nr:hypothetical protein C8F04DRAFT_1232875 [Mycena alexandri]
MKFSATISVFLFTFQGANAAVTLVLPVPTLPTSVPTVPSISIPSFSLPSGFSIPSQSLPPSTPTSSVSVTAFATVSVGGIESSDGATTYFLEDIEGIDGVTTTEIQTIVQGATVWHEDALQETCSLDGKGGAVCVLGPTEFQTSFTGTAIPIFTVGAKAAGAGGGGGAGGGSGTSSGSGGGSNSGGSTTGGAARVNGGASVGWMLVGTVAAIVAGMRIVL